MRKLAATTVLIVTGLAVMMVSSPLTIGYFERREGLTGSQLPDKYFFAAQGIGFIIGVAVASAIVGIHIAYRNAKTRKESAARRASTIVIPGPHLYGPSSR